MKTDCTAVENYREKVIISDESKIVVGQDSRVYVWRKRGEGWRPDLVRARKTKPCYEVMVWGCLMHMHGVGTISAVDGNINAYNHQQILEDNLWSVLARHFMTGNCFSRRKMPQCIVRFLPKIIYTEMA